MAHPLKKSQRKREEPKLGEPKLVELGTESEFVVAQELQGETVSDTLIRARQQIGQDLRSIAEVLCIRHSYLDAIERGQYENLPGATYAVGFVRTYAEYLGLDGEQVVERFKTEVEGLDSQTKLHFPTPVPEGKMPGGAVFLVAALLFAGAYGVWFYFSNQGESLGDLVAPVPERLQELVGGSSSSAPEEGSLAAPASPAPAPAPEAPPRVAAETLPATVPDPVPEPTAPVISSPAAEPSPTATEPAPTLAEQASETPQSVASGASLTGPAPAEEVPAPDVAAAPALEAPAAPQPDAAAAVTRQDSDAGVPAAPQAAAPASGNFPVAAAPQPEPVVAAEAPAATAPAANEPLAIPAAPDSTAPATAFLVNHEPKVYGEENSDARIVLKANQDAWVQVRDRQGTLLLTRVLRAGDSYRVPNQGDLTLLTGNAGGLEIVVDGRPLAPLGPVGAVRRNIPLDPQALTGGVAR